MDLAGSRAKAYLAKKNPVINYIQQTEARR